MKVYDTDIILYIVRDGYGNVVYASTDPRDAERMQQWNEWTLQQTIAIAAPKNPEV